MRAVSNSVKREILNEYYRYYIDEPTKARAIIKKLDYKEDHYLLAAIAYTYLHEDKLRLAERYAMKAFALRKNCPNTHWLLGLIHFNYGHHELAVQSFEEIIRLGVKPAISSKCCKRPYDILSEKKNARARINDSKFQLYRLLIDEKPGLAKRYFREFEEGLKTNYTIVRKWYNREKKKMSGR